MKKTVLITSLWIYNILQIRIYVPVTNTSMKALHIL